MNQPIELTNDLASFFSRGTPAQNGSNFGQMLERMQFMVSKSHPCRVCTQGVAPDGEWCRVCKGVGFTKPTRSRTHIDRSTTRRCRLCHCTGEAYGPEKVVESGVVRTRYTPGTKNSFQTEDRCPACDGQLYTTARVTVWPTGSSKKGRMPNQHTGGKNSDVSEAGEWLDEERMASYGRISRIIRQVRSEDELAARALELYYGPVGDRWGSHSYGREFALWPLTNPGRKLIEMGVRRSEKLHGLIGELDPYDLIASERHAAVQESKSDRRGLVHIGRQNLIRQAAQSARTLLHRSHASLRRAAS